jgi:hypothetical protein
MKKVIGTILCFCFLFLISCNSNSVTWILGNTDSSDNSIVFNNDQVTINQQVIDVNNGQIKNLKKTFTIAGKIIDDDNKTLGLYLLKSDSNGSYSILPECIEDSSHRKFEVKAGIAQFGSKEAVMNELSRKIALFRNGMDSAELKYGVFASVLSTGDEYVRK